LCQESNQTLQGWVDSNTTCRGLLCRNYHQEHPRMNPATLASVVTQTTRPRSTRMCPRRIYLCPVTKPNLQRPSKLGMHIETIYFRPQCRSTVTLATPKENTKVKVTKPNPSRSGLSRNSLQPRRRVAVGLYHP